MWRSMHNLNKKQMKIQFFGQSLTDFNAKNKITGMLVFRNAK